MTPYDALYKLFWEWLPERDIEKTCTCGALKNADPNIDPLHAYGICTSGGIALPRDDSPFWDWLVNNYQTSVHRTRSKDGTTYCIMKMNCIHAYTGCTISGCGNMTPERNIDDLIDFKGERGIIYNNEPYCGGFWSRGQDGQYKHDGQIYHTIPIYNASGITVGYADPIKFLDAIMSPHRVELKLIDYVSCLSDITRGTKTCLGSSCSIYEYCKDFLLDKGVDLSPDGKFYPMLAVDNYVDIKSNVELKLVNAPPPEFEIYCRSATCVGCSCDRWDNCLIMGHKQ